MSDIIVGFVEKIHTRQTNTGKTSYNIKLDDGNWYGHGLSRPKFFEGDEIEFTVEYNGQYVNIARNSAVVLSSGGGQQQQQQQGGYQNGNGYGGNPNNNRRGGGQQRQQGGYQQQGQGRRGTQQRPQNQQPPRNGGGGNAKNDYWEQKAKDDKARQKVIEYQAARNSAIETVGILLTHDCAPLPQKKADKMDAVLALIDTVTERYVEGTCAVLAPKQIAHGSEPADEYATSFNDMEQPSDFDDDIPFDQ